MLVNYVAMCILCSMKPENKSWVGAFALLGYAFIAVAAFRLDTGAGCLVVGLELLSMAVGLARL